MRKTTQNTFFLLLTVTLTGCLQVQLVRGDRDFGLKTSTAEPFVCEGSRLVDSTVSNLFPAGGDGSASNPYRICTAQQFIEYNAHNTALTSFIRLEADLDLGDAELLPIGGADTWNGFRGVFDGNNKTLSNFKITQNRDAGNSSLALFYNVTGTIKNLKLQTVAIEGRNSLATVAVVLAGSGVIENVHVSNSSVYSKFSDQDLGGIVSVMAQSSSPRIQNCSFDGFVEGAGNVGGIVSWAYTGQIIGCATRGKVISSGDAAGIAAFVEDATILQSYSTSSIQGEILSGGLVGRVNGAHKAAKFIESYFAGSISTSGDSGGIVGFSDSTPEITDCFWDKDSSGVSTTSGPAGVGVAEGLTTAGLQTASTFSNWSPSEWKITNSEYPKLIWEE